jgi:SAM-dependent methyltransferase
MNTDARTAELFDLDFADFTDDLPFYEGLAQRGEGRVLELGAGTGRAAIPLARAGFEVWGIENSEAMLARARCNADEELADRLHLLPGDMRDFQLDRQFDLIFAGLGAFHHLLTTEDQLACLRSVERHLAPDGLFVCDLRAILESDWESGESVGLLHDWTRVLPSTGETVMKFRAVRVDQATQVQHELHIHDVIDAEGIVRRYAVNVDLRFTTRYEMEGLLSQASLTLDQFYGDFELGPYEDMSGYMITVARKAS